MTLTQPFYTTVPESGMITLPLEYRGKTVYFNVSNPISEQTIQKKMMCETGSKKGILGLRGILKGHTMEELENARDEYLIEKYVHD